MLRDVLIAANYEIAAWSEALKEVMNDEEFLSASWMQKYYRLDARDFESLQKFVNRFFHCDVLQNRPMEGDCIRRRWDNAFLVGKFNYRSTGNPRNVVSWEGLQHHQHFSREILRIPLEWMIEEEGSNVSLAYQVIGVYGDWEVVYFGSTHLTEIWFYLLAYAWCLHTYEVHLNLGEVMFNPEISGNVAIPRTLDYFAVMGNSTFVHTRGRTRHWACESQVEKDMMPKKKSRSLLSLIKTYRKKRDVLITNQNAYTLLWITNKLNELTRQYYKLSGNAHPILEERPKVCKWLMKVTGEPWQYMEGRYFPQCMLKSYWYFNLDERGEPCQMWCFPQRWDHLKAGEEIVWNSEDCEWWYFLSKITYSTIFKDGSGRKVRKDKTIFPPRNFNEVFGHCESCSCLYEKKNLIKDTDTETIVCEICVETINLEPERQNVFGRYHSHQGWRWNYMRTKKDDPNEFCFGMEIEMHSKLDNSQVGASSSAWHINLARKKAGYPVICYFERDGSLGEGGLEMVTNPMSLNYHKEFWEVMLPAMREVAVGWNTKQFHTNDEWYGIHMTFSRKYWTDLQLARLVKFLELADNNYFVLGLAQRKQIFNGGNLGISVNPKLADRVILEGGKIACGRDRYIPVNFKSKQLVELRFFRSTLNTESFFKNLEWLWSFRLWCQATPFSISYKDYLNWVLNNPKILKQVPNLINYFSRDKLPVRGCARNSLTNPMKGAVEGKKPGQVPLFNLEPTAPDRDSIMEGDIECV